MEPEIRLFKSIAENFFLELNSFFQILAELLELLGSKNHLGDKHWRVLL